MADPIPYPMIAWRRYSWASVKVNVGNAQFTGVKSINFNEKIDPQKIHGTGQAIIGSTAGMYDADGDLEMYEAEAIVLIAALTAVNPTAGWMNVAVPVQVQYIDDFQPTTTIKMTVRLIGATGGGSESGEALTTKFTMFFLDTIEVNGIRAVPKINAQGLNGPIA